MPRNTSKEIIGLLPKLTGLIDPTADREIYLAFLRLYEYFSATLEAKVIEVRKQSTVESQLLAEKTSQLINNFATKLIGKDNSEHGNNPLVTLGSGTVTSVSISAPSIFNVTGNPITEAGNISISFNVQLANTVLAGPAIGVDAIPTFRSLVSADLPATTPADPDQTKINIFARRSIEMEEAETSTSTASEMDITKIQVYL